MHEYREFTMKRIMVATDFSGTSYGALKYARHLAISLSAKVLLVHVVDPIQSKLRAKQIMPDIAERMDSAEEELGTIYTALREDGVQSAMSVRPGGVREVIIQMVEERKVDLLVIGTHGQGYKGGEGLGSVAKLLFRSVPCPVLIVAKHARGDAWENTHPRNVLFPTDFSQISRSALAYSECLTKHLAGQMVMLHVDEKPNGDHKQEFQRFVNGMKNPSLVTECLVRVGHPAHVINEVSSEKHADFIVMGVHGSHHEHNTSNNEIAFDVIRWARCPVFTLAETQKETSETPKTDLTEAEEFRRQQERLSVRHV